jgi:hypothetical protein
MVEEDTIRGEIEDLEEELESVTEQISIYRRNLNWLEEQTALKGGEVYLSPGDRNKLDQARDDLTRKGLEYQEIRRKLAEKERELQRVKEIERLKRQLSRAMAKKQPDRARVIASRLQTLEPTYGETTYSELEALYWEMALQASPNDYSARRKAWLAVESICDELGDDNRLRDARYQLAKLYDDQGEAQEEEGQFKSAAHFYHRALTKYVEIDDGFEIQRMLGKLIRINENLENVEAALRYSWERIELLSRHRKSREAAGCSKQALRMCSYLNNKTQRDDWEQRLAKLIGHCFDRLDDDTSLQQIANYSKLAGRHAASEIIDMVLLLHTHRRSLSHIDEKIASYSSHECVPPALLNQRDREDSEIERLEGELRARGVQPAPHFLDEERTVYWKRHLEWGG